MAHIKTDSIKIPDATPEIIQFVMDFGERYGYTFEHEATYDRMCLVNDAVYIAKYKSAEECQKMYGYVPGDNKKKGGKWTATGTQFQIPYVFKKLFSREEILFEDMCETKSVSTSLYLDLNENLPDVSEYEKEFSKAESDYKKGLLSDITFENTCQRLNPLIAEGHDYHFIGKVGQFCPIKAGRGGGLLVREKDGKYYAATGAKGYHWLESEMVRELDKTADIDRTYYDKLVIQRQNIVKSKMMNWILKQERERCILCFEKAREGKKVSLICSGDAGVYGMASLMYEIGESYPDCELSVVPGVTAALSGAACLGAPLNHDFCVISLSDLLTPWEKIEKRLRAAADGDFAIAIYNPSSRKRADYLMRACDILLETVEETRPCGYVENIGRDESKMELCTLKELRDRQVNMFTTVFIGNSETKIIDGHLVTKRGYHI